MTDQVDKFIYQSGNFKKEFFFQAIPFGSKKGFFLPDIISCKHFKYCKYFLKVFMGCNLFPQPICESNIGKDSAFVRYTNRSLKVIAIHVDLW